MHAGYRKTSYARIISAVYILTGLFIAAILGLMVYYCIVDEEVYIHDHDIRFIEEWTVDDGDGNTFTVGNSYVSDHRLEHPFTISTPLPEHIREGEVFCFRTANDTYVYIDGILRKDFISSRDVHLPGGAVMLFYMTVPLEPSDAGSTLSIVKTSSRLRPQLVFDAYISDMAGVYSQLMSDYGLSLCLSLIMLILSVVVVLISIFMRIWYRREIEMLYASSGIMVISAWLVTNSYLYPFLFGHYHIYGIVNYMLCLIMPIGILKYLDSIQEGRHGRIIAILMIICAVNTFVWTVLHFAGIFSYAKALTFLDAVLGVVIIISAAVMVSEFRQGYIKRYAFTGLGLLGLIVSSIIEIIVIIFFNAKNDAIPMMIGLAWLLTFVVVQQIDDLRRVSEEKQHAIALSDAKTSFLANMSHEIRTPINSILGMNEMILRENRDPAIDEYSRTIKSSGRMLLALVNDVLDFSRIESGRLEIRYAGYSLAALINSVESMILERADDKGLEFKIILDDEVPNGQISDEFRIKQILINLLTNAVKYTDKGGVELGVSGTYTGETSDKGNPLYELCFKVKDTGRGIKKEDQKELFSSFTRMDMGKNRNIEGTGLGLAIVKSICDSMSADITVESEYGRGSVFTFRITVEIVDGTSAAKVRKEGSPGLLAAEDEKEEESLFTAEGARILAVDDNAANLKILKLFLKRTKIDPDLCHGGLQALEMCRNKEYDLILLDHMMPSPDGIETLKLIREDPKSRNKATGAIVVTANVVEGSRQMYMDSGFADCLTKPIDSHELEEKIREYLPSEKIKEREEEEILEFSPGEVPDDTSEPAGEPEGSGQYEKLAAFGVDTKQGIDYCGSREFYGEVLSEFAKDGAERLPGILSSYEGKDWKNYSIHVHAVKNTAKMIGANGLSDIARELEMAADGADIETIVRLHGTFTADYGRLVDQIRVL